MPIVLRASDVGVPLDVVRVFGREGPLVLEIGFGNGEFLETLADESPEWNVLGVDTSPSSVVRARKRLLRGGCSHVRLFCGDARHVVRSMAPTSSLFRVFLNFPDPWPRRRHARRRLMEPGFLTLLASRLSPDGAISFTTDHPDYFAFALASVETTGLYRIEVGAAPTPVLNTRWARRWLEQNRSIHHALFHRQVGTTMDHPRLEITEMRHSLLRGDLMTVSHFEKTVLKRDGATIVLSDVSRSIDGSALVFQVIVEEDDLSQHALIDARPKGEDILVGVTGFGKPLSTKGLNEAVVCVAEYLESCGLEVLKLKY